MVKGQPQRYLRGHAGSHKLSETPEQTERRFWSYVDKRGPDECWLWLAARTEGGYGRISIEDRQQGAHRYALSLRIGPIPPGMIARHRCDNPPCCNPDHLMPGTALDNIADRNERGRTARGSGLPRARLTEADVTAVLLGLRDGVPGKELAQRFGVSTTAISRINRGRLWTHVPRPDQQNRGT